MSCIFTDSQSKLISRFFFTEGIIIHLSTILSIENLSHLQTVITYCSIKYEKIHLLLSPLILMVDDGVATDVVSIVDWAVSSPTLPSVFVFVFAWGISIGNCRLDPVFTFIASPRHCVTCTNNNACDIVSKFSHRSHFKVSKHSTKVERNREKKRQTQKLLLKCIKYWFFWTSIITAASL